MNGFEMISDIINNSDYPVLDELIGKQEKLQSQLETELVAGNTEKVNYLKGRIEELKTQITKVETKSKESDNMKDSQISFGSTKEGFSDGHSESYWKKKAGEEYIKNGESSSYKFYLKRAGEAKANSLGG